MKLLALLLFSTVAFSDVNYYLDDVVNFKFVGQNRFYEKKCSNIGMVNSIGSYDSIYLIAVKCDQTMRFVWVENKDIIGIVVTAGKECK